MSAQSLPLYVQIQNFIRGGIDEGRFTQGDRLPSEPELAQRFATTRATVAKAFAQLVFEGVISRRIGSGTYVGAGRREDRVDTTQFASFEEHVLAAGRSLEYELIVFRPARASIEAAGALELDAGAPVYRLERLRRVEGRPTAVEIRFVPHGLAEKMCDDWLRTLTVQDILRDCLGLSIERIDNAVSAAIATERLGRQLGIAKGRPLLAREHTIFGKQNRALLWGKTMYPGDFRIRYTLRSDEPPRRRR